MHPYRDASLMMKKLEAKELGSAKYLDGRKRCREHGFWQIPLLEADKLIMNHDPRITRPCLVKELAAYPEKNGKFKRGEDILDSENKLKLSWEVLTKFCSPSEFAEIPNIALLVKPSDNEDNFTEKDINGNIIVVPESISIVPGFLQVGGWGFLHESGLVVEGEAETEGRYLYKSDHSRFGPISRGYGDYVSRRSVIAYVRWSYVSGVVGVRETFVEADEF